MNTLKFFLKFRKIDLGTKPFLSFSLALNEFLEFIQHPSFDELGDFLWFLGINNPWSIRKIMWRGNFHIDTNYPFLISYKELSTKGTRQMHYKARRAVLETSSNISIKLTIK